MSSRNGGELVSSSALLYTNSMFALRTPQPARHWKSCKNLNSFVFLENHSLALFSLDICFVNRIFWLKKSKKHLQKQD